MRALLFAVLAVLALHPGVVARDQAVTFIDLNALAAEQLAPQLSVKTVVGRSGSFILAELAPGTGTAPHHHTHEQANYGLAGDVMATIGGTEYPLTPDRATVSLPDVEHVVRNIGTVPARFLEMTAIRRTDFLPPRARITIPQGPMALPVPPGRILSADFTSGSAAWSVNNGVATATLHADHTFVRVWEVGKAGAVDLRASGTGEQFSYLVHGAGEVTVEEEKRMIAAGTLIVITSDVARCLFRSTGTEPARIIEFHILSSREPSSASR